MSSKRSYVSLGAVVPGSVSRIVARNLRRPRAPEDRLAGSIFARIRRCPHQGVELRHRLAGRQLWLSQTPFLRKWSPAVRRSG